MRAPAARVRVGSNVGIGSIIQEPKAERPRLSVPEAARFLT